MLRERSTARRIAPLALCVVLLMALRPTTALALAIDLSLNVLYTNPANATSGGTWELVAKSDDFGLFGLTALLTNIATAQNNGPRGLVNGSDPAGMAAFFNAFDPLGFHDVTIGQSSIPPSQLSPGEEQSVFYGIGTLTNGAPNYPSKPPGSNSIGPAFTSLSNVNGVPWANTNTFNEPAWATAAKLVTGTFAPGVTPGFYSDAERVSRGITLTSIGTSINRGNLSPTNIVATTIVRTNLIQTADYNHNGIVDAADYVVWRNTLGSTTLLDADGDGSGTIDAGDYSVWRAKFGTVLGSGTGSGAALGTAAVPEPAGAVLLMIGAALVVRRGRRGDREKICARPAGSHARRAGHQAVSRRREPAF